MTQNNIDNQQSPEVFIEQLTKDINVLRPSRFFYREVNENSFELYFNQDITLDPEGKKAFKLLTVTSKFTVYSLVTSLNFVLLNKGHEFSKSVARRTKVLTNSKK